MQLESRRDRAVFAYIGAGLALLIYLRGGLPWDLHNGYFRVLPFGHDFVNFWLGGQAGLTGSTAILTDRSAYNALIVRLFAYPADDPFVFSYPPHALLLLAPLGALPFVPALLAWTTLNLAGLALATRRLGNDWHTAAMSCIAPGAIIMILYGHFGGLIAAALTYVLGPEARRQPLLAGLMLAVCTVKPQLAVVVALLMLALGHWRAVFAGAVATFGLVMLSVLAYGVAPWERFLHWTVPFHVAFIRDLDYRNLHSMLTSPYAGLRMLGLGDSTATVLQHIIALPLFGVALWQLHRDGGTPRAVTLALTAGLLALPYSQAYDFVIVVPFLLTAMFAPALSATERIQPHAGALLLWLAPAISPIGLVLALPLAQVALIVPTMAMLLANNGRWRMGFPSNGLLPPSPRFR